MNNTMVFDNGQDVIDLSILEDLYNEGRTSWGIKLSGGADSALVAYMLVKIIQDNKWDVNLHAITGVSNVKPYNAIFAKQIMDKIEELTEFKFAGHHYDTVDATQTGEIYAQEQEAIVQRAIAEHDIRVRFAGITANPPKTGDSQFLWEGDNVKGAPSDSSFRDRSSERKSLFKLSNGVVSCLPLINTDKRGVAEMYKQFNIVDDLFPVTRSCEAITSDFSHHCGECWFCQEREWGFGRLE